MSTLKSKKSDPTPVADKTVVGLAKVPSTAIRAANEIEAYKTQMERNPNKLGEMGFGYVFYLKQRIEQILEAASPKNFQKTTALSLVSKSLTESLGEENPKDFLAASYAMKFFSMRLQMVVDHQLNAADALSLRDMCIRIAENTTPYVRKSTKTKRKYDDYE